MAKQYSFNVSNPILKITASSNIAVSPSKNGTIQIEVTGADKAVENISVRHQGNTVEIVDRSSGSSSQTIISNGGNVMTFSTGNVQNISMVNGEIHIDGGSGSVFVNGKRINLDGDSASTSSQTPTTIKIYAPLSDLDLTLKGTAKFASSQLFDSAYVDLSGATQAILSANSLDFDLSGTSELKAEIKGGDLVADASGTSNASIVGDFKSCKADTSGTSKIVTLGTCLGDYKADASGCSNIRHKGNILGRSRERVSGVASVNI